MQTVTFQYPCGCNSVDNPFGAPLNLKLLQHQGSDEPIQLEFFPQSLCTSSYRVTVADLQTQKKVTIQEPVVDSFRPSTLGACNYLTSEVADIAEMSWETVGRPYQYCVEPLPEKVCSTCDETYQFTSSATSCITAIPEYWFTLRINVYADVDFGEPTAIRDVNITFYVQNTSSSLAPQVRLENVILTESGLTDNSGTLIKLISSPLLNQQNYQVLTLASRIDQYLDAKQIVVSNTNDLASGGYQIMQLIGGIPVLYHDGGTTIQNITKKRRFNISIELGCDDPDIHHTLLEMPEYKNNKITSQVYFCSILYSSGITYTIDGTLQLKDDGQIAFFEDVRAGAPLINNTGYYIKDIIGTFRSYETNNNMTSIDAIAVTLMTNVESPRLYLYGSYSNGFKQGKSNGIGKDQPTPSVHLLDGDGFRLSSPTRTIHLGYDGTHNQYFLTTDSSTVTPSHSTFTYIPYSEINDPAYIPACNPDIRYGTSLAAWDGIAASELKEWIVAEYPFDLNFNDVSGNNHHATIDLNGLRGNDLEGQIPIPYIDHRNSIIGNAALQFEQHGTDLFPSLVVSSISLFDGLHPFSMCVWVWWEDNSQNPNDYHTTFLGIQSIVSADRWFSWEGSDRNGPQSLLRYDKVNQRTVVDYISSSPLESIENPIAGWTHLCVTFDNTLSATAFYINGSLMSSQSDVNVSRITLGSEVPKPSNSPLNITMTPVYSNKIRIGSKLLSTTTRAVSQFAGFAGWMDNLVVFNNVLSPDHVRQLSFFGIPRDIQLTYPIGTTPKPVPINVTNAICNFSNAKKITTTVQIQEIISTLNTSSNLNFFLEPQNIDKEGTMWRDVTGAVDLYNLSAEACIKLFWDSFPKYRAIVAVTVASGNCVGTTYNDCCYLKKGAVSVDGELKSEDYSLRYSAILLSSPLQSATATISNQTYQYQWTNEWSQQAYEQLKDTSSFPNDPRSYQALLNSLHINPHNESDIVSSTPFLVNSDNQWISPLQYSEPFALTNLKVLVIPPTKKDDEEKQEFCDPFCFYDDDSIIDQQTISEETSLSSQNFSHAINTTILDCRVVASDPLYGHPFLNISLGNGDILIINAAQAYLDLPSPNYASPTNITTISMMTVQLATVYSPRFPELEEGFRTNSIRMELYNITAYGDQSRPYHYDHSTGLMSFPVMVPFKHVFTSLYGPLSPLQVSSAEFGTTSTTARLSPINYVDISVATISGIITFSPNQLLPGIENCSPELIIVSAYAADDINFQHPIASSAPTTFGIGSYRLAVPMQKSYVLAPRFNTDHSRVTHSFTPSRYPIDVYANAVYGINFQDSTVRNFTVNFSGGDCGINIGSIEPVLSFPACSSRRFILPSISHNSQQFSLPATTFDISFDPPNGVQGLSNTLQKVAVDNFLVNSAKISINMSLEDQSYFKRYYAQTIIQLTSPNAIKNPHCSFPILPVNTSLSLTFQLSETYNGVSCDYVDPERVSVWIKDLWMGTGTSKCGNGCEITSIFNGRLTKAVYNTTLGFPYFFPRGNGRPDYSRDLFYGIANSLHPEANIISIVITGIKTYAGAYSVKIAPSSTIPLYILRDPPGGGSKSSYSSTISLSSQASINVGTGLTRSEASSTTLEGNVGTKKVLAPAGVGIQVPLGTVIYF